MDTGMPREFWLRTSVNGARCAAIGPRALIQVNGAPGAHRIIGAVVSTSMAS